MTFAAAVPAAAQPIPSSSEVQHSINSIRAAQGQKGEGVKVLSVESCYPADLKETFICLVRGSFNQEVSVQEIPIKRSSGKWEVLDPGKTSAAAVCPDNAEATKLLRALKNRSDIDVVGEVDDGHGTFSDERGTTREKKGPLRLMCRFNVNDSSGSDRLYLSYVGYTDGKYFIDPDVEVWD